MNKSLWKPSEQKKQESLLEDFSKFVNFDSKYNFKNFWQWSVENSEEFWSKFWDYSKIIGDKGTEIIRRNEVFNKTKFFPDSKINYAENILKKKSSALAIRFLSEKGFEEELSLDQLYTTVCKFSHYFKSIGLKKGDRVAGYVTNKIESIISLLACAKSGIIWSSCSPDFGTQGVVDRFKQIVPSILITSDHYFYNGKKINILEKIEDILKQIPSIKKTLVFAYNKKEGMNFQNYINFDQVLEKAKMNETFERFEFNHPIYVLFSSGTTGKPKCITHGAGNVLVEHNKEFMLHCDIRDNEKLFYYTTTGWMMWNWLVGGLATGSAIFLFDGAPFHPEIDVLLEYCHTTYITLFYVFAKYIYHLKNYHYNT